MLTEKILIRKQEGSLSLDNHLLNLCKFLQENKENSYENFSKLSKKVKNLTLLKNDKNEEKYLLKEWDQEVHKIIESFYTVENFYENLTKKISLLEKVGFSIPLKETFALENQLQSLAQKYKEFNLYFFGKIFTLGRDYYVIYGEMKIPQEISLNSIKFFVSQDIVDWKELRDVFAWEMRKARKIFKLFSGNLTEFQDGIDEEVRLKYSLLRIITFSKLIPDQYEILDEDNQRITLPNKEFILEPDKFNELENWVKKYPQFLVNGDFNYKQILKEEILLELEDKHPIPPLLQSIQEDEMKIWKIKIYGSNDKLQKTDDISVSQKTILFVNDNFPDALNIYNEELEHFVFIYMGFGLESNVQIVKQKLEKLQMEPKFRDNRERSEPNPPEENSDVLETDSDPEEND